MYAIINNLIHTHTVTSRDIDREMLAIKMTNKLFGTFALNRTSFKLRLPNCV